VAKQQKCGTCRFFQEAGLAGSGWCHHPDRKTSSDVMIMVRRSELACRDDWSRSLWQPASAAQEDLEPQFARSPLSGPMPPATQKDLTTLLAHDMVSASESGEDVLLSEARIISEAPETNKRWETPVPPIQSPNFDPRTAIFRAREAYRDKVRARSSEARLLSSAEPVAEPVRDSTAGTDEATELISEPASARELQRIPHSSLVPRFLDEDTQVTPIARPVVVEPASVQPAIASKPAVTRHAAGPSEHAPPRDQGVDARNNGTTAEISTGAVSDRNREAETVGSELPADLPDWYRTDLPRVCRTCRDYRPSADGMRGWCANSWAFTHRRLVQSDDPAPCHSAIGDWWAPVDDVWLVAADVSSHGRATPHLDRIGMPETVRRRRS
jgi:hypothetical protein